MSTTPGADRQKRRAAESIFAQEFDHALCVLVALDDDILKRAAEHHVHRALEPLRNVNQIGNHAVNAAVRDLSRLQKHLLDGIVIALVITLHFAQQLQSRIALLELDVHIRNLISQPRVFLGQPLYLRGRRARLLGQRFRLLAFGFIALRRARCERTSPNRFID